MTVNNTYIMSQMSTSNAGHDGATSSTPILFIFASCALGAFMRTCTKRIRLPYTVLLLMSGAIMGIFSGQFESVQKYTVIASMDPQTILNVFLPVLVFESAFSMETHTFLRSLLQIFTLAIPGLAMAACMTAAFAIYVFDYGWNWSEAMVFGAILSATDPVAVVALLRELGASKTLATTIEGESLLNDGAAIVLFHIFIDLAGTGGRTVEGMILYFIQVALGGPVFGFIMAKLTVFWLVNIFNDALVEITITLASTYLTYYIGEQVLGVSGVLAVVVLGVILSQEKTSISPEVEAFLHRFWNMLAYLANTLIFILVGLVITEKATAGVTNKDWILLILLYFALNIIRAIVIAILSPVLKRIGYGMSWQGAVVMVWGGLRGAVGLALALVVIQHKEMDETGVLQAKILLHAAGIVMLTLLINATTISSLLRILGMSEISMPKRMAMAAAVRNLRDVISTSTSMYMGDRFLADADWDIVDKYIQIQDPYETVEEETEIDQLTDFNRTSKCPFCENDVPNEPSRKEYKDMQNEARLRILKAEKLCDKHAELLLDDSSSEYSLDSTEMSEFDQAFYDLLRKEARSRVLQGAKTSYMRQFEHGMLSREAVRRLVECVDYATDREGGFIAVDEIKQNWEIRGFYDKLKKRLKHWQSHKPDESVHPRPSNKILRLAYITCMSTAFEVIIYFIIITNVAQILWELIEEFTMCAIDFKTKYGIGFEVTNYVFIVLYIIEAVLKILAFQKEYFKSKWNVFDLILLILSMADVILGWTVFSGAGDEECDQNDIGLQTLFQPNIFKIAKGIRLLRILRSLRLVKGLIPQMIDIVNNQINKKLRMGYDVGKGYITGEEEVLNNIDVMVDNKKIAKEIKSTVGTGRLNIMKELGMLQKNHPGIAVSIKTQQASRRILNNLREQIYNLRGEGVLDEAESQKLEGMVEIRMKKLLKIPATVQPPPPEKIIGNLNWVSGDQQLIEYIKHNAKLESMSEGEELMCESDSRGGIYVVISGLVKVDKFLHDHSHASDEDLAIRRKSIHPNAEVKKEKKEDKIEKVSDYMSTGSVLGEMALLTGKANDVKVTCDTSVQLYHIPYEAIQAALELFTDEPSLEYRLWRVAANRICISLLSKHIYYRTWAHEKIKMHLEKSVLYLKKWEVPEGGIFKESTIFDTNSIYMSDIFLVHGSADCALTRERYVAPCHVPSKVDKLNFLAGRTDKHVILIVPRDMSNFRIEKTDQNKEGIQQGVHEPDPLLGSFAALSVIHNSSSDLCLRHASNQRINMEKRIKESNSKASLKASLSNMVSKVKGRPTATVSSDSVELRNSKLASLPPIEKPKKHVTVTIPDNPTSSKVNPNVSFKPPDSKSMTPVEKPDLGGPGNV